MGIQFLNLFLEFFLEILDFLKNFFGFFFGKNCTFTTNMCECSFMWEIDVLSFDVYSFKELSNKLKLSFSKNNERGVNIKMKNTSESFKYVYFFLFSSTNKTIKRVND